MPPQGTKEKTEAELLQGILGQIGEALAAPDADVQFLQILQQAIVQHVQQKKQQGQQQVAAAATMGGGADQSQGPGNPGSGQGPGAAPPPNQIAPGGGAGFAGLSTMTNPDEMSRMMAPSAPG